MPAASALRHLERIRAQFGAMSGARAKLELLDELEAAVLRRARDVLRLHEALLFLLAYPDNPEVLERVERMLRAFAARADLKRHRRSLAGTGIAGTEMRYGFYAETAAWLAARWGKFLRIDWPRFRNRARLEGLLPLLAHYAETPALDEVVLGVRQWMERLKGPAATDAAFLIRRFAARHADPFVREIWYEDLDIPLVLRPGPDTPARTREKLPVRSVAFRTRPLDRSRPDLRREAHRQPRRIVLLPPAGGREVLDLARGLMVARQRDLDVFIYGSRDDVRIMEWEDGLRFALIGFIPERRLMLESLYGYVALQNGVPVGYGTVCGLFGSAEIAYNLFDAWRGGEAGRIFARLVASARALFAADTFSVSPYQMGEDNDEALHTGAWWFYQKLGFRARDPGVLRLMRREMAFMRKRPRRRSSIPTLKELASDTVYFHQGRRRDDVLGLLDLGAVGLHVVDFLASRFGGDRDRAAKACSRDAAVRLGVPWPTGLDPGEQLWWERWSPLLASLPGLETWSRGERHALARLVRAKGGRRESEYARLFDRHTRLRSTIRRLARRPS